MSCIPQSLLRKKSEMCQQSGRLYSQTPLPFWRAKTGYKAIGSLAATEPLVRFLVLHEPMDKEFFPYKRLQCSTRSISHGTEITIVTEYIFHMQEPLTFGRKNHALRARAFCNSWIWVSQLSLVWKDGKSIQSLLERVQIHKNDGKPNNFLGLKDFSEEQQTV